MKKINTVIKYYYLYTIFSNFLLFLPVLLLIYTKRNITVQDMLLIEACYYFTIFLFEIPTGYLGDKIGHDELVMIGLVGTTLAYVVFAFSYGLPMIIVSQVLLGIFGSCISGSDSSSLAVYIEKSGEKDGLVYQNEIYILSTIGMLISFILSGPILKINSFGALTFLITAATYIVSAILYMVFVVHKRREIGIIESEPSLGYIKGLSSTALKETYLNKDVIICGTLIGIVSGSYVISQIFYNNFKIDAYFLGILYCLANICTIIFNKLNFEFDKKLMFLMPLMYLVTIFNNWLTIFLFILISSLIKSKVTPFIRNYVLMYSADNKAYNMSLMSFVYNIINVIFMVSLSRIIHVVGFTASMIALSALLFILLIYLYAKSSLKYKLALGKKRSI